MTPHRAPTRRGLVFLEFIMALAITAMVAAAIAAMVSAVSSGELSRRDNRDYIVRTYTATSRLSAYVARSRAVLAVNGGDAVIWLNDWRGGGTVHATEIRWLIFNNVDDSIEVHYVDFPDTWTEVAQALEDQEYVFSPASPDWSDWSAVFSTYNGVGYTSSMTLVDGVDTVQVTTGSSEITFDIEFKTAGGGGTVGHVITIRILRPEAPIL